MMDYRPPVKGECILRLTQCECSLLISILKASQASTNLLYLSKDLAKEREALINNLIITLECFV